MKVNGAAVNLDGKSSKSTVEPVLQPGPENRWGVWVTGFGDFVNVDSDSKANGYDFTIGGKINTAPARSAPVPTNVNAGQEKRAC
jgi:hypothetical protein